MKQESILKSFINVGFAGVLNLVIGFFTTPVITRIVKPEEYGKVSIFGMYTSLALMFLCLGMDQALLRFYYKTDSLSYKRRVFGETLLTSFLIAAFFVSAGLLFIRSGIIAFEFDWFCSVLLAINILGNVLYRFSMILVRLNHNSSLYGKIEVINRIVNVATALILLKCCRINGVYSLSIAMVAAVLLCVFISLYSQRHFLFQKSGNEGFDRREVFSFLRYGYPYIFSMGLAVLFQSMDKMALNHYKTYAEVGVYTSAMALISMIGIIQTSFSTIWGPRSVEHYEEHPDDTGYYSIAFSVITVIMFTVGITLILIKDVFALLLGESYREAAYIMPFLVFYPVMYTVSEITVGGISFARKSKMHVLVSASACLTNLAGNYLLVPRLGGRGAAISTGISYIVFFIIRTILSERYYYVGFELKKFMLVTCAAIGYALYSTFFEFGIISVLFAIVCYLILIMSFFDTFKMGWEHAKAIWLRKVKDR